LLPVLLRNCSLTGAVVLKAATRHGCVVVSLELLQLAQQQRKALDACTNPDNRGLLPAQQIVLQWLQHSDVHAKLPHGTAIFVQVGLLLAACTCQLMPWCLGRAGALLTLCRL